MAEPKPLASLSAGLLARKGMAKPAMRRQTQLPGTAMHGHDDLGWNDMGYDVDPAHEQDVHARGLAAAQGLTPMAHSERDPLSDLDRALDHAALAPISPEVVPATSAPVPPVRVSQQELAAALSPEPVADDGDAGVAEVEAAPTAVAPSRQRNRQPRARAGSHGRFAFTLRLDPQRHLRLRLASAATNRSTQQILVALVDDYLSSQPAINAFAEQLPGPSGS